MCFENLSVSNLRGGQRPPTLSSGPNLTIHADRHVLHLLKAKTQRHHILRYIQYLSNIITFLLRISTIFLGGSCQPFTDVNKRFAHVRPDCACAT